MDFQKAINKLEKQIAKIKAKKALQEGKRFLKLAKENGHRTIDEFIKALAPFASPVMKGRLGATKAAEARDVGVSAFSGAAAKVKRTRARIDDKKRAAIVDDLKAEKMTAKEVAVKHGVSVPSVSNIKKAAGLVKK